jgi:hypothetical protein
MPANLGNKSRDFSISKKSIPCQYSSSVRSYGSDSNVTSYIFGSAKLLIVTCQVTSLQWLVNLNLKPAVEDTVAVEGVVVGVDSTSKMSQDHYLARVVKLGPVRTSKEMCLPSDLATKEKMVTCYALPRRSWPYTLVLAVVMMHVRSGNPRSNWCCRSPRTLTQYLQGMQYGRRR